MPLSEPEVYPRLPLCPYPKHKAILDRDGGSHSVPARDSPSADLSKVFPVQLRLESYLFRHLMILFRAQRAESVVLFNAQRRTAHTHRCTRTQWSVQCIIYAPIVRSSSTSLFWEAKVVIIDNLAGWKHAMFRFGGGFDCRLIALKIKLILI